MFASLDILSVILIMIGSIMVYGAKSIFKYLKIDFQDGKFIILKLVGLLIAMVGFFRILEIF